MFVNTLNALMIPAINATPTQPPGMENVTMILGWILWALRVLVSIGGFLSQCPVWAILWIFRSTVFSRVLEGEGVTPTSRQDGS